MKLPEPADRHNTVTAEIRCVEVRVVEDIEELSSELQREAFAELEVLEGGEIQPLEGRSGKLGGRATQQAEATIDRNASRQPKWGRVQLTATRRAG